MKLKVGIIVGNYEQTHLAQCLEHLPFDLHYFIIDKPSRPFQTSAKVYLFEDLKDMPGYLRGLEDHINQLDLLIGFETSRLASFQMVRTGVKFRIPTIVISTEINPYLYHQYPNIRAIQTDIYQHAHKILALSDSTANILKADGVKDENLCRVTAPIQVDRFQFKSESRQRFRDYLSIGDQERLVIYQGAIEPQLKLQELIAAVRVLKAQDPYVSYRLLMIGDGAGVKDLKYYCHDFRTANMVMFMHQDPSPFLQDLYCAADARIYLPSPERAYLDFDIVESTLCGAVPIYPTHASLNEILLRQGKSIVDTSMGSFANAFEEIFLKNGHLAEAKRTCVTQLRKHYELQPSIEQITAVIEQTFNLYHPKIQKRLSLEDVEKQLHTHNKGIETIETALTLEHWNPQERADLLRMRADRLSQGGDLEESMHDYENALQLDPDNFRSYRGLGYLAFKGHSNEDAIHFFKKALAKNKDDGPSLMGVGLIHRRLGLNEEALYWLERSADVDGVSRTLTTAILQTGLECNKPKLSIETIERVMEEKMDTSASVLRTLAQLYLRLGDTQKSGELNEKASLIDTKAS